MKMFRFIIWLFFIASCSLQQEVTDIIDFNQILEVNMRNNLGDFYLNTEQIVQFKSEMLNFNYEGEQVYKVGGISSEIILKKDTVLLLTNTNGDYAELIVNGESHFYKMNGMNLDNYSKND